MSPLPKKKPLYHIYWGRGILYGQYFGNYLWGRVNNLQTVQLSQYILGVFESMLSDMNLPHTYITIPCGL